MVVRATTHSGLATLLPEGRHTYLSTLVGSESPDSRNHEIEQTYTLVDLSKTFNGQGKVGTLGLK